MKTQEKWNRSICLAAGLLVVAGLVNTAEAQEATWAQPSPPENAALVYYRAFLLISSLGDTENKSADDAFKDYETKGVYDAARLTPFLERNAKPIDLLLQAASIAKCDFGVQFDQGQAAQLPELARARELARIGVLAMGDAANSADWPRSVSLFAALLRLGQGVQEEGTVIGSLVATRMVEMIAKEAGVLIALMPGDEALYGQMQAALDRVAPALNDWSGAIEGERKMYGVYFPPPGSRLTREQLAGRIADIYALELGDGLPSRECVDRIIDGTSSPEDRTTVAVVIGCNPEDLANIESINALLTRWGSEMIESLNQVQEALKLPYVQSLPRLKEVVDSSKGHPLKAVLLPALGNLAYYKATVAARLEMLREAIEAARWRQAHRAWPTAASQLPSPSRDPFAENQTFEYRTTQDDGFFITSKGRSKLNGEESLSLAVVPRSR